MYPAAAPLSRLFKPLQQLVQGGGVVNSGESIEIACCGFVGELVLRRLPRLNVDSLETRLQPDYWLLS
jgi:hypothetical protein